ncbi:MAG: protein-tyrosine phosphatase [Saprospiraceae bacterium]|jgi:protein-tyrosine phosphatase
MKILMVCLGNICRSPLAEGILRRKVEEKDLNWQVDSAGTGSWHVGELPDSRSIDVGTKYGIDLATQRARQFKKNDLDRFDLIFAMDSSNYQNILKLAESQTQKDKVKLIMNEANPGRNEAVPDPYWDDDGFEKIYQMLDKASAKIIENYDS